MQVSRRQSSKLWRRTEGIALTWRWLAGVIGIGVLAPTVVMATTLDQKTALWFASTPVADYMRLFDPTSSWPVAESHLDVLKLTTNFASNTGDRNLQTIFNFLDAHKIALALEGPMLSVGADGCGAGVEGYRPEGVITKVVKRIHDLGGHLRYIAMDEPLWFGHFAKTVPGRGLGCQLPISEVARNVGANIAAARVYFPDVEIGDELPLPNPFRSNPVPPDYLKQVQVWLKDFEEASGRKLAFVHLDTGWSPSGDAEVDAKNAKFWPKQLKAALTLIQKNGIRTGIFYMGNRDDRSGEDWVNHALERARTVENDLGLRFQDVIFQSWMPYPKHVLPENDPDALTNSVVRYLKSVEPGRD